MKCDEIVNHLYDIKDLLNEMEKVIGLYSIDWNEAYKKLQQAKIDRINGVENADKAVEMAAKNEEDIETFIKHLKSLTVLTIKSEQYEAVNILKMQFEQLRKLKEETIKISKRD